MTVSIGGTGTADIAVNLAGPGGIHPSGFNVTNLQGGVTSVTVEFNFSNPLAADFAEPVPRSNSPFLVGFRTQNYVTPTNFDAE